MNSQRADAHVGPFDASPVHAASLRSLGTVPLHVERAATGALASLTLHAVCRARSGAVTDVVDGAFAEGAPPLLRAPCAALAVRVTVGLAGPLERCAVAVALALIARVATIRGGLGGEALFLEADEAIAAVRWSAARLADLRLASREARGGDEREACERGGASARAASVCAASVCAASVCEREHAHGNARWTSVRSHSRRLAIPRAFHRSRRPRNTSSRPGPRSTARAEPLEVAAAAARSSRYGRSNRPAVTEPAALPSRLGSGEIHADASFCGRKVARPCEWQLLHTT